MTKHPSRKVLNFRHLLGCDTIGYGTAAAELTENLWYLCTVPINVYVASPDPDPNRRGGGQLPNPKSAILR